MRNVNSSLADRLESSMQTYANNANPAAYMRIQRHNVPLHNEELIERTRILKRAGMTDSDVAVCHPHFLRDDEQIWVSYVRNGVLHVKWAENTEVLSQADWNDYHFTDDAVACSIAFDSTIKHNARGIWEFITDEIPWVFWVTPEGALKAKLCTPLGQYEHELAVANVTDCSAVRGAAGEHHNWDLGLTVFFIMAGQLYYRQYINGVWYDAERVTFDGLDDLTMVKIKAFNTWDYRVGVQILADDGNLYELFTYIEGIGVHNNAEHEEFGLVKPTAVLTPHILVTTDSQAPAEHEEFGVLSRSYNYSIYGERPINAENIEDFNGNWGTTVDLEMSEKCTGADISQFKLVDSLGSTFQCVNIEYHERILRMVFNDFNTATGNLTVVYTAGTLTTPVIGVPGFSISFTPANLGTATLEPKFSTAANNDVKTITVVFDKALTDNTIDVSDHIMVICHEYNWVPGGSIVDNVYDVTSTEAGSSSNQIVLHVDKSFTSAIGNILIHYDGNGGLTGANGRVQAFLGSFTPVGLTWVGNHMDAEHEEFAVSITVSHIPVDYINSQAPGEHEEFGLINPTATMTHIQDL